MAVNLLSAKITLPKKPANWTHLKFAHSPVLVAEKLKKAVTVYFKRNPHKRLGQGSRPVSTPSCGRRARLTGRTATQHSKKGSGSGEGSQKGSEKGACYGFYS